LNPGRTKTTQATEEENDSIKKLEVKQMDSKGEIEIMDALDQVRERNARIHKA